MTIEELFSGILCHPRVPQTTKKFIDERFCNNTGKLVFKSFVSALITLTSHSGKGLLSGNGQRFRVLCEDGAQTDQIEEAHQSFYHILAGVTHLEEIEIAFLEHFFEAIADPKTLKITEEIFNRLTDGIIPGEIQDGFFRAFDENHDNLIDFKELICGLSASCRGPDNARLKFLAQIWDLDSDGYLTPEDIQKMYQDLKVAEHERIFTFSKDGNATLIDFVCWACTNDCVKNSLLTIAQRVGYVCLGLKPLSAKTQLEVLCDVKEHFPLKHMQLWQVVPADLWSQVVMALNSLLPWDVNIDYSNIICTSPKNGWTAKPKDEYFVELYPPTLLILRHSTTAGWLQNAIGNLNPGILRRSPWRYLSITRATDIGELRNLFAQILRIADLDAVRLWVLEVDGKNAKNILTDDTVTLHQLGIVSNAQILLEIRNQDMSWPEELIRLRSSSDSLFEGTEYGNSIGKRVFGVTGLCNLGNTCYMNAAIQCLSNVQPLTDYFIKEWQLNGVRSSSLSLELSEKEKVEKPKNCIKNYQVAMQYKNLISDIWMGKKQCLIPSKFKETMANTSEIFTGRDQHDCQEFLAILLDLLHDELNSVKKKEPTKIRENGEDSEIADESWNAHLNQEQSIIVNLFHGQLKSSLKCLNCEAVSSRFDPFSCIQLQIPMEQLVLFTVTVIKQDGEVPYRYSFRVPSTFAMSEMKEQIAEKCKVDSNCLIFLCIDSSTLRIRGEITVYCNNPKTEIGTLNLNGSILFAYELGQPYDTFRIKHYFLPDPLRVAVHRRMAYNSLCAFREADGCTPVIFGIPVVMEFKNGVTTSKELYESVWKKVERLIEPRNNNQPTASGTNRAIDASEDIRSGYPFELSIVDQTFDWCGICEWHLLCRGCPIAVSDAPLDLRLETNVIPNFAIHWKPASFHLRYQQSLALACIDDPSVSECHNAQYSPTTLASCFEDFVRPEVLDDAFKCEKCEVVSKREKALSVWRMPKILIVHFKRFVYIPRVNRWAKSTKIIDFPLTDFDPRPYFAPNAEPTTSHRYDCIAMACHEGSMIEGHYIAYAKNSSQWFRFNDSHCQPLKENQVNKNNAYIVFFERVD
uniref:ubiquitinyl hydrolase 1 n=1 Tax=Acrobeloides nanus TaxID=290746 RepID=A0A914EKJ7_9BILA